MERAAVFNIVNDLTKDSDIPMDLVNQHTSKLQNSLGLLSGTIQKVSNENLKELAGQAQKPSDFVAKYKQAASQNTPFLAPMMDVLHGFCGDENVKDHFVHSSAFSSDIQKLKERLLQQVGPSAIADDSAATQHRQKRLFEERPHLTLDYLSLEHLTQTHVVGPLGNIPVKSQESAIIDDLLYCFIGIEGTHIKPVRQSNSSPLSFTIDETLDPSLKELLHRITPLCHHYSVIIQFAEDKMQLEAGRVNQALAGALYQLIKDYYIFVSQLEVQHRKELLTLNKVWFYIQPTMQTMSMLAECVQSVDKLNARGGKTLSLLYQQMVTQAAAGGSESCRLVAEFLARQAAKPYFEVLGRWIHRGIIVDGGKDFFVEDNEVVEMSASPLEYSDDYWERRYSIRSDQIPAFLHSYSDMILRTGKYLNVIQQCDKSIKWPEDVDDIVFKTNPEEYILPLEKANAFASKTLLDLLVKDRDLIGHLRSVKHYFLLDQGDFIVQFMDLCELELLQNVNNVEPARLESLLELAQRTSAANTDPYKDNVTIELLPYDLEFQMCKILSIDTDAESDFKTPANASDLTGLEAFAFNYNVQWPISLVLNRKFLACYQMLLRHLFFCKHVERQLCNAWLESKATKPLMKDMFQQCGRSFALRQKMLNFIQNLEYYMTFEVLEPNWEDMIAKIKSGKVTNVDQVLKIHDDFLNTCLNDCMLSTPELLTTVKKILGICSEFAEYLQNSTPVDAKGEELEQFHESVTKFDLSFTSVLISLLDKIAQMGRENYNERILNIMSRLDFNGFYSRTVEQFGSH